MLVKFVIYGALLGLALADVKHLSREYLPPSAGVVIKDALEVPSLLQQDAVVQQDDNDIEVDSAKASPKESTNDPAYGGSPYGVNGLPGQYPGGFPSAYPSYPGGPQGFPGQGFPGQGFPGQGFPGRPGQGFPPQGPGFPGQGFPGQGFPPSQGFPGQGFPGQGFSGQGFPGQGFPGQGFPGQGIPGQGFPGQGFPGQGFPGQGFPGQGFPPSPGFVNPGFPGQGFPGQGFPNPAYPHYPPYHTSAEIKQENKPEGQDGNLLVRTASDTIYDNSNGGYLYNKPSKTF